MTVNKKYGNLIEENLSSTDNLSVIDNDNLSAIDNDLSSTNNLSAIDRSNMIQYAPRAFKEGNSLFVPQEDDDNAYFARGWFKIIDQKPSYNYLTQKISFSHWNKDYDNHILSAIYVIDSLPTKRAAVKKFSKLKITLFCIQHGLWNQVKAYLESIGYYDLYVMAQYFLESDEFFQNGLQKFKNNFQDVIEDNIDDLIDQMLVFAKDGYEMVDIPIQSQINDK